MTGHLFPFLDYWWFYAAFTGFVVAFLVLDLGVFHRKAHAVGFREASTWTVVWAALALLFCLGLYKYAVWNFGATTGKQTRSGVSYWICRRVVAFARQHVRFRAGVSLFRNSRAVTARHFVLRHPGCADLPRRL